MSVAKLLADAKREAGDKAVEAAKRTNYQLAREWRVLAVEIDRVLRDAVELMSR